jgi:serine/threonine-protein kinase
VILWALNKNPADRPKSADDLISALERAKAAMLAGDPGQRTAAMAAVGAGVAAGGVGLVDAPGPPGGGSGGPLAPPVAPVPLAGNGGPPDGPPTPDDDAERRRRRRWPWVVAALAILALAGSGAAAYLLTRPVKVTVPNVYGEQINTARTVLQNAGFKITVFNEPNAKRVGTVIGEIPSGGSQANQGSTVSLTVSTGPGDTTVPTLAGETVAQAKRAIRKASLKVGPVVPQSNSQYPAGQVFNTSPAAGVTPPVGTAVTLFVSTGPPTVTIPGVIGESLSQAKSDLHAAGFDSITTTTQTSSAGPSGSVISQSPAGGTSAVPGSTTVNLVVAQAPKPTPTATVPSVTGENASTAASTLRSAGFTVVQTPHNVTKKSKDGIVLNQSPGGGTSARKGSTVTIIVGHFTPPPPSTTTTSSHTTSTTSTTTTTRGG